MYLFNLQNAYQVNLLIAGFEKNKGPVLYWMDYLSAMQPMPFGIHGYGSFFCLGLLDKKYKPGMPNTTVSRVPDCPRSPSAYFERSINCISVDYNILNAV